MVTTPDLDADTPPDLAAVIPTPALVVAITGALAVDTIAALEAATIAAPAVVPEGPKMALNSCRPPGETIGQLSRKV